MSIVLYTYLFVICTVAFFLYYIDKKKAIEGRRRIQNSVLLTIAWIGGAYGALMGMLLFSHKTRSKSYIINVPLAFIVWLLALIIMRVI